MSDNNKYDVDYFIKKFKAIPPKMWTTYWFKDEQTGAMCALGHCGARLSDSDGARSVDLTAEAKALERVLGYHQTTTNINDGRDSRFQQKTPKARILAALKHIKKWGSLT